MTKRKPNRPRNKRKIAADDTALWLYGSHAVRAALANPQRRFKRLLTTQNAAQEISALCDAAQIQPNIKTAGEISAVLPPDAVHQGLAAEVEPLAQPSLDALAAQGKTLILLDHVSDPRNVGAILRAAAVFGAGGVLMTRRNSPPAAAALAKTAVGALEVVPLVEIANLARALEALHKAGYMSVGLDETGDKLVDAVPRDRPLAVVMGAEGAGLRRLTRETCDMLARLPVAESAEGEAFATLNVATATAVALYALSKT